MQRVSRPELNVTAMERQCAKQAWCAKKKKKKRGQCAYSVFTQIRSYRSGNGSIA